MQYNHHFKELERFLQMCLRRMLGMHWKQNVTDVDVLERAECLSIEAHVHKRRLRWSGHVARMVNERLPKQISYGELVCGCRPQHKPKKGFKDCLKRSLQCTGISTKSWAAEAADRAA